MKYFTYFTRGSIWRRLMNAFLCGGCVVCVVTSVNAEKWVGVGEYQIHYNAVYSLDLSAEVARATQLPRGRYYSWVIVSVRQKADGLDRDVAAAVQGDATNLLGQRVVLDFKHIKETGGQYYIAPLRIAEEDVFRFAIAVEPESSHVQETIRFQQSYRVDSPL